jgi:hypothetical protein
LLKKVSFNPRGVEKDGQQRSVLTSKGGTVEKASQKRSVSTSKEGAVGQT